MTITGRLRKTGSVRPEVRSEEAIEYEVLAGFQDDAGDFSSALASLQKELEIREGMLKTNPAYPNLRSSIALVSVKVGEELGRVGSRDEALRINLTGMNLFESLAKDHSDARLTRELAITKVKRGDILMMDGLPTSALASFRQTLAILEPMAKADPRNALLRQDLAGAWFNIGRALVSAGKHTDGLTMLDQAIRTYEQSGKQDQSLRDIPYALGVGYIWQAEALLRVRETRAALESCQKAVANFSRLADLSTNARIALAVGHTKAAAALGTLGKGTEASAAYHKALDILEPLRVASSASPLVGYAVADVYFGMGELSKALAEHSAAASSEQRLRWSEARDWYRKSTDAWRSIHNPGAVGPTELPCGNPVAVSRALALCDTALQKFAISHR
jgi:tetratricopeptide (TPR) repeat protein